MPRGFDSFQSKPVKRRDFIKLSAQIAAALGLSSTITPRVAKALEINQKPAVIWVHFQECGGCSDSLLRAEGPDISSLIFDLISLEYHVSLSAASGQQSIDQLKTVTEKYAGQYLLIVEGSIPTKNEGMFCLVGGQSAFDLVKQLSAQCAALIAIGSCASWGGIPSSGTNPTGALGVDSIIKNTPIANIPGCPPSPYNFLSTLVHYLTYNQLPNLDRSGRPLFAYGRLIHEQCERRAHFDAGRFAQEVGDKGHKKGYCLYKLGCKGPSTYGNCPEIGFNRQKTWPVSIGHPCFGCIEAGVGFKTPLSETSQVLYVDPPQQYAQIETNDNKAPSLAAAGAVGAAIGGVATAVVLRAKNLPTLAEDE